MKRTLMIAVLATALLCQACGSVYYCGNNTGWANDPPRCNRF